MENSGPTGEGKSDNTIERSRTFLSQSANAPRIRRARLEDCEKILKTREASLSTLCSNHYTAEQIAAWIGRRQLHDYRLAVQNALALVAEKDQEIIGFAEMDLISGMIHALYVHPACIGHGVGRALLSALEDEARSAGLRRVHLKTTLNSVAFFQGRGFLPLRDANQESADGTPLPCVELQKWL
jgi:N-acetylglutamate synthase-like GNAT family acetyltransferase